MEQKINRQETEQMYRGGGGGAVNSRTPKNKIILATIFIASIMVIIGTISYAYFSVTTDMKIGQAVINTATVSVRFADNDQGISGVLNFGESLTKRFTIENTGTIETSIRMSWIDLINTYLEGSLTYTLSYSEDENGEYEEIIESTSVPRSQTPVKRTLASILTIPVETTYYYELKVTLNNLPDVDQNADRTALFSSRFGVEDLNEKYQVTFDGNGGEVEVLSMPIIENSEYGSLPVPTRENKEYEFVGWFTERDGGEQVTEDSIVENYTNHTLYAHWKIESVLMAVTYNYAKEIWSKRADITKVVFENSLNPKDTNLSYDISAKGNGSVMGYLVSDPDNSGKYIAYIQADGKIQANPDSSHLFYKFTSLESIDGLQYFDTSNVTNMSQMFRFCSSLTELDLDNFETGNVTTMEYMFSNCAALTTLNLSNWGNEKVTTMEYMFDGCSSLESLDLTNFGTSSLNEATRMFGDCSKLSTTIVMRRTERLQCSVPFIRAATSDGAQITVNYTADALSNAKKFVSEVSGGSKVILGEKVE